MNLQPLRNRLDRMPMLKALVPFAAGIVLSGYGSLPLWFLTGAFLLSGATALLMRSSAATLGMLLTAGFAAAQLRTSEPDIPVGVHTSFELRIGEMPADRGRYATATARVEAWRDPVRGTWHPASSHIRLYADSLTRIDGGERILCRGTVRPFRQGSESYRKLMRRRGVAGTLWLAHNNLLERLPVGERTLHLRASERLARLPLTGDAAAVVRAMTAGDRSGLTPKLRTAYSRSGLSHLLAVSGLHTGIVFVLINLLLWWLPLLRRGHLLRNLLAAAAVWCFVAAAGFPPSAVRAAVMCTLLQAALASASEYVALNALAAAAFGMLLWNPAWIGDVSFQLSFAAVAAILAWGVPLCRRCHTRWRAVNLLADAYLIGLAATLGTAPLVSHLFGIVPLAGLLINPAAIALATVVVFGGALWLLLPLAPLAAPLAWAVGTAAEGINALARLVAALPGGAAEYTLGSLPTAGIYLLLAAGTLAAWCREPKKNVLLPS